jgi:hypothetical protein
LLQLADKRNQIRRQTLSLILIAIYACLAQAAEIQSWQLQGRRVGLIRNKFFESGRQAA